jgi:hypothetical protein
MRRILGRLTLVISLTVASLGLIAATGEAAPNDRLIFTPTADTYVDQFQPDTNFGSSQALLVRAGSPGRTKQTLLRFEVPAFNKTRLLDVRLRMFQSDGSDVGGRVRGPISGTWDESTVTWNTRPSLAKPIRGKFGAVKAGHSYEISLGTTWISGGGGPVNLGMDSTSTNISQWGSKEHHTPPQLILILRPRSYPTNVDKFTFNPVADTYVDESQPGSSFGDLPSMWVDNDPTKQAFLRFHVEGLASPKSRTIVDVRLRLFQVDASPQGGRVFQITDDSWNESMTWGTKPPIDGPQRNSFGSVAKGRWYEVDLSKYVLPNNSDQDLNLAVDSVNGDGARWASSESGNAPKLIVSVARIPGFVLDGLSTVASTSEGASEATFFASQHHMAKTVGGRLLVVYGRHASGLQLAWRDRGGGWQTDTTGSVTGGQLLSGTGTGDWPASIVIAKDSNGREHAWVVWGRENFSFTNGITMRRLSNLDSARGPKVGRKVTVEKAGLGTAQVDIGIERDGTKRRAVIVWTRKTGASSWAIQTKWFTNLGTDAPTFIRRKTILTGSGSSRGGTLVPSAFGMRLAIRDKGSAPTGSGIRFFGHNLGKPLDTWWNRAAADISLSSASHVAGVALSSGRLAATADTANNEVIVQMFSKAGNFSNTIFGPTTGFAQPVLSTDGTNLYLVMIDTSDGSVVVWKYNGSWTGPLPNFGISASDCGNDCSWPNTVRGTDGRLRYVVDGPPGPGPTENAVLAFQRHL